VSLFLSLFVAHCHLSFFFSVSPEMLLHWLLEEKHLIDILTGPTIHPELLKRSPAIV
jgi:hypothetical protein